MEAARGLGLDLTVASEQASSFESARPTDLVTVDIGHPERAADQVRDFAARHPIDAVVGVDDDTAVTAAAISLRLGLRANPLEAVLAARDKYRQRQILAHHAVPIPRFHLFRLDDDVARIAGEVAFPCVVKPLRLSASRGVIRADDLGGLGTAVRRLAAIVTRPDVSEACADEAPMALVEEYVPGVEVALEALIVDGRFNALALFDKPDPLEGPFFEETIYVTPSRLAAPAQQALRETGQHAARALGLVRGPVHAELRWNERGPWVIELAARPIGGRCSAVLRFGDGVSLEELVLREALAMPLGSLERERRAAGVMMIPVPGRGVLRAVEGVGDARAVPGVDDVVITAHVGQTLVPWPEGARYPGFIFARGDQPAQVEAALREAHRRLRFELDEQAERP